MSFIEKVCILMENVYTLLMHFRCALIEKVYTLQSASQVQQKIIKRSSKVHQKFIKSSSKVHQKFIRSSSEAHQKFIQNSSQVSYNVETMLMNADLVMEFSKLVHNALKYL